MKGTLSIIRSFALFTIFFIAVLTQKLISG